MNQYTMQVLVVAAIATATTRVVRLLKSHGFGVQQIILDTHSTFDDWDEKYDGVIVVERAVDLTASNDLSDSLVARIYSHMSAMPVIALVTDYPSGVAAVRAGAQAYLLLRDMQANLVNVIEQTMHSVSMQIAAESCEDTTAKPNIKHLESERPLKRLLRMHTTLREISEKIQATLSYRHTIHVMLTGTTANYGLRFNRAALLLFDKYTVTLHGEMAIGHYSKAAAMADWEQHPDDSPYALQHYLEQIDSGDLPSSALDERIRDLTIPLQHATAFERALASGQVQQLTAADIEHLPAPFRKGFQPGAPLIIAPLIARKWVIGVLVADNKFTGQAIEPAVLNALVSLPNTAALALDNHRLLERSERANTQMRSLFEASNALLASREPRRVLEDIVFRVKHFMDAVWVSALLIDDMSIVPAVDVLVTTRQTSLAEDHPVIRPNGCSVKVMRERKIAKFEDTSEHQQVLNRVIFDEAIGAAFCLPLVFNDQSIGVMWIHCRQPRRLSRTEEAALQLYVTQATMAYNSAQQIENLDLLRQASEAIGSAVTWEQVSEAICRHAKAVLYAQVAFVWPYDSANDQFLPVKARAVGIEPSVWQSIQAEPPRFGSTLYHILSKRWDGIEEMGQPAERIDPTLQRWLVGIGAESWQGIGLQLGNERLGVLSVCYDQPHRFTNTERQRAQTFAGYAAQAMKKAILLEQLSAAHNTARLIARVSVMENLDSTLRATAERMQQVFHASVVNVYAYNPVKRRLSTAPVQVGTHMPPLSPWTEQLPISPILAATLQQQEIEFIPDTHVHPLYSVSRFTRDECIRACVAAPLRIGGQTVGALFLNYCAPHHLSADDIEALRLITDQLAVAVRNDHLKRASRQRADTLEALHDAAQALLRLPTLDDTLEAIVQQAVHLIPDRDSEGDFSVLALHDEHNHLKFVAAYPSTIFHTLQHTIGAIDLNQEQIGIIGRAFRSRQIQNVSDVHANSDYLMLVPSVTTQLSVPIQLDDQVFGVLSLERSGPRAFSDEDARALATLARYAAIAIRTYIYNKRPIHILSNQPSRIDVPAAQLRRISHTATNTSRLHVLQMACARIEEQMHVLSSIRLYDEDSNELIFDPRWSPSFQHAATDQTPHGEKHQRLSEGICGWVATHLLPYVVEDVRLETGNEPRYIELHPKPFEVRSELAVPILYGIEQELIGVLDVQSAEPHRFSASDVTFLEVLADQLAITIQMAKQYDSLSNGMRSILAWKSNLTENSAWWHGVKAFAERIRKEIQIVRLKPLSLRSPRDQQRLAQTFEWIDEHARKIIEQRVPAPLTAREHIEPLAITSFISDRVEQIKAYRQYDGVEWSLQLHDTGPEVVEASREWIRHALDLLIANAVDAMAEQVKPHITVRTDYHDGYVRIFISDSGPGIAESLLPRLFSEQIEGDGQGLGLLIVAVIANNYGGNAKVETTGPHGTTMQLSFPAVR